MRRAATLTLLVALAACSSTAETADTGTGTEVAVTKDADNGEGSVPAASDGKSTEASSSDTSTEAGPDDDGSGPANDGSADTTDSTSSPEETVATLTMQPPATVAAEPARPYKVFLPSSYDGSTAMPLVVLLHGYGGWGEVQEEYFDLGPVAEERGFLFVHPDGTIDASGRRFWNATDACCDEFGTGIDDATYLFEVITQISADYAVDAKRVYIVGHSNGGFMAYRMACEHAEVVTGIVSLAGATPADTTGCVPSVPVSVLEIHGTADNVIGYDGGQRHGRLYPGAAATVATWAGFDGCDPSPQPSAALDLTTDIDGVETEARAFSGCRDAAVVELWTMAGGGHLPNLTTEFAPAIIDFLFAHPRP